MVRNLSKIENKDDIITIDYLNKIKNGGRNLLRDSDRTITNNNYLLTNYYLVNGHGLKTGEPVTVRFKANIGDDRVWLALFNSGGSQRLYYFNSLNPENGIFTATFKWNADDNVYNGRTYRVSNTYISIYVGTNKATSPNTIEWIKLERGYYTTDWTPAYEDYLSRIEILEQKVAQLQNK
ncbi:hypothetical protein [Aerococcus urinae]|uniref:hypothetical protein n=1 Tax=Aerococcus urinae TaxID=1376 RepID=UPI0021581256|nr:hypothetical protein [Aerococcus urinae]